MIKLPRLLALIYKNKSVNLILWVILPLIYVSFIAVGIFNYVGDQVGWLNYTSLQSTVDLIATNKKIYAGMKFYREITAVDNNLDAIFVRFYTFDRQSNDTVAFRIKEKDQPGWFYENSYQASNFKSDQLFPFVFPVVKDAKGKSYEIEIESQNGGPADAVAISRYPPQITTRYLVDKEALSSSLLFLLKFSFNKLINLLVDHGFLIYLWTLFIPLIVYFLIFILISRRYSLPIPNKNLYVKKLLITAWLPSIILGLMILDVFFIKESSDSLTLLITLLSAVAIYLYKVNHSEIFLFSLCFIISYPILFMIRQIETAEKIAAWGYIFVFIGAVRYMLTIYSPELKSIKSFLQKIRKRSR